MSIALVTVVWVGAGYALAFGDDISGGLIGGLEHPGMPGLGPDSVPTLLFATFQLTGRSSGRGWSSCRCGHCSYTFLSRTGCGARRLDLPMVMLGAGLLWFGWFGFNVGSALGANGLAAAAFLNTLVAGVVCSYAVGWKFRLNYDDSLDVVGVHLVGGVIGTLLIGVFATESMTGGPRDCCTGAGSGSARWPWARTPSSSRTASAG